MLYSAIQTSRSAKSASALNPSINAHASLQSALVLSVIITSDRHTMRIHGQMYLGIEPPFVRLIAWLPPTAPAAWGCTLQSHIWPRPVFKGKKLLRKLYGCPHIYGVSLVRQRPDGLRAFGPHHFPGVYRHALSQVFRKQVRPFPIVFFPLVPVGLGLQKRLAGRLRATHAKRSRVASGMTNAGLCRKFVFGAMSQKAPGDSSGFIGQPHAGAFCPAPRGKLRQPCVPAH